MSKNLTCYSVYDRTEKFNWIKPLKTFSTFKKAKRFFDSNEEAKLIEKYYVTKSKSFRANGELFYESTIELAFNKEHKFSRKIFYSRLNIHYY